MDFITSKLYKKQPGINILFTKKTIKQRPPNYIPRGKLIACYSNLLFFCFKQRLHEYVTILLYFDLMID